MKKLYSLLILIIFLSFQTFNAQSINSSIIVKKNNDMYFISGIVPDEQVKNQIIEIIKDQTAGKIDAKDLKINNDFYYLSDDWQKNLTEQISKIKDLKTAFVQFKPDSQEFPAIPESLLNTEILLIQKDKKIKLADYKNNVVILSFVAPWSLPARVTLSELKKLYAENLPSLKIIAVNIEDIKEEEGEKNQKSGVAVYHRGGKIPGNQQKEEELDFKKFVKTTKINFQTGWADKGFTSEFFEISKFNGIPQSFVIKNGRLRGVFLGSSTKVNESLVNLVRKVSTE